MRNNILIFLIAISISSCGVFRKKSKEKTFFKVDSVVAKSTTEKSIDTGSVLAYRKITVYSQPALADKKTEENRFFNYPWALVNATTELVNSTEKLKNETNNPFYKPPPAGAKNKDNGTPLATLEEWSLEKKGLANEKNETSKLDLKKAGDTTKTNTEGNPATVKIVSVIVAFVFVILCIFAFLYWKSRVPKL